MKIVLEFDDETDALHAIRARRYSAALHEIAREMRGWLKIDISETEARRLTDWRRKIFDACPEED